MDDKCRDNSEVKYSFFVNESISIIVKNILAIDSAIPHCLLPPPPLAPITPPPISICTPGCRLQDTTLGPRLRLDPDLLAGV